MSNDNVTQAVIRMAPETILAGITAVSKITETLNKLLIDLLDQYTSSKNIKAIRDHAVDNKELDYTVCRGEMWKTMSNRLNAEDIPNAVLQDAKTGAYVIITRDTDRERVRDIKNELLGEKGLSRISTAENYRRNAGHNLVSYSNLNGVQVKLFQEEAQRNNFIMSVQKQEDGTFKVHFSQKDAEKAKLAISNVIIKSSGVLGRAETSQAISSINNVAKINDLLKDSTSDFYVMSSTSPYENIHITPDGFEHIRSGKTINAAKRYDGSFVYDLHTQAMGLAKPIICTANEYEKFTEIVKKISEEKNVPPNQSHSRTITLINEQYKGDVEKFLKDYDNGDINFSVKEKNGNNYLTVTSNTTKSLYTDAELRHLKAERDFQTLISIKMSLENGNQPENISSFYNGDVSFSEFFAHEVVNDDHDIEEKERVQKGIDAASRLDALPEKEQAYIRNIAQNMMSKIEKITENSEIIFVNPEKLKDNNLDDLIQTIDEDGDISFKDSYNTHTER